MMVDAGTLTSAAMGKTQRAVSELFSQSIAEAATGGPVIVLLDEVETLAADRFKMSLEANPIDVHRATDAVLVQLDLLAEQNPRLLFVATSNFPQAVDKGAGEGGINAVGAAIAAAIDDAIGISGAVKQLPITPQRLRALLRQQGRAGS
jgi:hypothetical protein